MKQGLFKFQIFTYLIFVGIFPMSADLLHEADSLFASGRSRDALSLLRNSLEESPRAKDAGAKNLLAARCALAEALPGDARMYISAAKERGVNDAYILSARMALEDYDFDLAKAEINRYTALIRKAKKSESEEALELDKAIDRASAFLERVEKIAVVDNIPVSADDFYGSYRLSPAAGKFLSSAEINGFPDNMDVIEPVFLTESGDRILFSALDPDSGLYSIYECSSMSDGSLGEPVLLDLNIDGNCAYPFLMQDGVTLYFASDGKESLGGYDIFVSTRDAADGEFFQPSNLGFPYNSPADDFLLAIDDETGYGWWTSSRKSIAGDASLFVYKPTEIRENYDSETVDVIPLARLDSISLTWGGEDLSGLSEEVRSLSFDDEDMDADFYFQISADKTLTSFEQLSSEASRTAMEKYIDASNVCSEDMIRLADLRKEYSKSPSKRLSDSVLSLESKLEKAAVELKDLRNEIFKIEKINNR